MTDLSNNPTNQSLQNIVSQIPISNIAGPIDNNLANKSLENIVSQIPISNIAGPVDDSTLNIVQVTDTNTKIHGTNVVFDDGDVSKLNLITIKSGIYLYHGSQTKNSFDPTDVKLSEDSLLAIFSNSKNISSDVFMNCSQYPSTNGYLHKFIISRDIPNIQVISPYNITPTTTNKMLESMYCNRQENPRLNGFAYPIRISEGLHKNKFDYVIGLCRPNDYVKYVSTMICVNPYRISTEIDIFGMEEILFK